MRRIYKGKSSLKDAHIGFTLQYLPILLHNLSRINTHDKFTLEDTVIAAMIGSKVTSFPKTHDAGYRSLARVV